MPTSIAPARRGLLGRWRAWREMRQRMQAEDALKHLHAGLHAGATPTAASLAGALSLSPAAARALIARMQAFGWLADDGQAQALALTPEGEAWAMQIIRAHRLWERYLSDEARMPLQHLHAQAERREHHLSPQALDALEAALGHPARDPHGDPIPNASGRLAPNGDLVPLTDWPPGAPARIAHVEDEPTEVFARIAARDLRPGSELQVIQSGAGGLTLADAAGQFELPAHVAANIFVGPAPARKTAAAPLRLPALQPGQSATVLALDEACQGLTRRRFLDLGLTPGVQVRAEYRSAFGSPTAYRVRGSLIAMRPEQAEYILIKSET